MSQEASMKAIKRIEQGGERVVQQQTVEIHSESLIVACTADGVRYLSVSAICRILKIDHRSQLKRIRNIPELNEHLRQLVLHFLSGGDQPVYCLPVECINPWLIRLQAGTVKEPLQPLLQTLRQELLTRVNEVCPQASHEYLSLPTTWGSPQHAKEEITHEPQQNNEEVPVAAQHVLAASLPPVDMKDKPKLIFPIITYAYPEHTAFREASVAKPHRWTNDEDSTEDPYFFSKSTQLQVYVSRPTQPIGLEAAMRRIAELGASTVLTARIAWGLYNARHNDQNYAEGGWVAIDVSEFLLLRNLQMHSRAVSTHSETRTSDGYFEKKYIERLQRDLELLNGCHIRRWLTSDNYYDSPYLRVSMLMERKNSRGNKEKDTLIRVAVSPGEWMPVKYHVTFDRFSKIDESVFALSLKTDVNAILIGLYLTERWRQQALQLEIKKQQSIERGKIPQPNLDPWEAFRETISVRDLLEASVIEIDQNNLTSRFANRIVDALQKLYDRKILAMPAKILNPVNTTHNWGDEFLKAQLLLLPNLENEDNDNKRNGPEAVGEVYQLTLLKGPVEKMKAATDSTRKTKKRPPTIYD